MSTPPRFRYTSDGIVRPGRPMSTVFLRRYAENALWCQNERLPCVSSAYPRGFGYDTGMYQHMTRKIACAQWACEGPLVYYAPMAFSRTPPADQKVRLQFNCVVTEHPVSVYAFSAQRERDVEPIDMDTAAEAGTGQGRILEPAAGEQSVAIDVPIVPGAENWIWLAVRSHRTSDPEEVGVDTGFAGTLRYVQPLKSQVKAPAIQQPGDLVMPSAWEQKQILNLWVVQLREFSSESAMQDEALAVAPERVYTIAVVDTDYVYTAEDLAFGDNDVEDLFNYAWGTLGQIEILSWTIDPTQSMTMETRQNFPHLRFRQGLSASRIGAMLGEVDSLHDMRLPQYTLATGPYDVLGSYGGAPEYPAWWQVSGAPYVLGGTTPIGVKPYVTEGKASPAMPIHTGQRMRPTDLPTLSVTVPLLWYGSFDYSAILRVSVTDVLGTELVTESVEMEFENTWRDPSTQPSMRATERWATFSQLARYTLLPGVTSGQQGNFYSHRGLTALSDVRAWRSVQIRVPLGEYYDPDTHPLLLARVFIVDNPPALMNDEEERAWNGGWGVLASRNVHLRLVSSPGAP